MLGNIKFLIVLKKLQIFTTIKISSQGNTTI